MISTDFVQNNFYAGPEIEAIAIDRWGRVVNVWELLNAISDGKPQEKLGITKEHMQALVEVEMDKCKAKDLPGELRAGMRKLYAALGVVGAQPLGLASPIFEHGDGMRITELPRFTETVIPITRAAWETFRFVGFHVHASMPNEDMQRRSRSG